MPLRYPRRAGLLLQTGQTTTYVAGDDGAYQKGISKAYSVLSTGAQSGTTAVDVPSYAGAGIAFAATTPGTITDTGNGLATFKTGDTIIVKGTASNSGVFTVSTGNVAGTIRTTEATVLEAAGAVMSIYKRAASGNNVVLDVNTGLYWTRRSSGAAAMALKIGLTSAGTMAFNDTAYHFALHAAAADLQMIAGANPTLRIVGGAGEIARYHVGDTIVCAGFATAINNIAGYAVLSVTVNGADLDIVLDVFGATLVAEVAAGARTIKLVCQSVFAYCNAARAASLGGFSDWRIPTDSNYRSLPNWEAPLPIPDATAFPNLHGAGYQWSSTTTPSDTTKAETPTLGLVGNIPRDVKTGLYACYLVRG